MMNLKILLIISFFFFDVVNSFSLYNRQFAEAMDNLFVLDSASSPVSAQESCLMNIRDLLIRQKLFFNVTEFHNLTDVKIYEVLILSAMTGISPWKRDDDNKIKLTDFGYPIHPSLPTNIESDVMTCIICALLIVIATFHLINIFSLGGD